MKTIKLNMTFETLKGTKDSTPVEQIKINRILSIIQKNFERFGFRPFDTPIIEYFETLAMKYDDDAEIVQEIFKLSDRGERSLGLRYDLTTPLSRFVAEHNKTLKKPFKRYQIGKVFRDGPIKAGRLREFMQCDADVVGETGQAIEAELMLLFFDTYKELNIDAVIELNNNKILRGALLQFGFLEDDLQKLILSIDKLKKIGIDGVLKEVEDNGFDKNKANDAIEILNSKTFEDIRKLSTNEELIIGINELEDLVNLVSPYIDLRVNFSMSRGLAIYTGNIWEVYEKQEKISSSIGGGGRYDKVIGEYASSSEIIPAVGISFGLVPILACLNGEDQRAGVTDILVVPLDKDLEKEAFKLARNLRKNNNVEIFYKCKLKKAFDYATMLGCEKIAILGKKDLEEGVYTLKNIETGKEEKIKLN